MRIFACVAYVKIPNSIRKKLELKDTRYMFFGYCKNTKAYKLMSLDTKRTMKSCNVDLLEYKSTNKKWEMYPS